MNRKILVIGGILILLAIVGFLMVSASGIWVNVVALPKDSKIELDGRPIKAGRVKLAPGKHVFKASRQYFDAVQKSIDTNALDTKKTVYLLPKPSSQEAIKWLNDHPEVQQEREAAGGEEAIIQQQSLLSQYPFIAKLPYETLDYKIDYSVNEAGKISFIVTLYPFADPASPEYGPQVDKEKQAAKNYLSSYGVDTEKVPISYNVGQ
jgi:hypothetical protein